MKMALHLAIAAFGWAILYHSTATVQGEDYTYTTNNGTITLTRDAPVLAGRTRNPPPARDESSESNLAGRAEF